MEPMCGSKLYLILFVVLLNRDAQSLLPLTVKQIYNASQSSDDIISLIIDSVDVTNLLSLCILVFEFG